MINPIYLQMFDNIRMLTLVQALASYNSMCKCITYYKVSLVYSSDYNHQQLIAILKVRFPCKVKSR